MKRVSVKKSLSFLSITFSSKQSHSGTRSQWLWNGNRSMLNGCYTNTKGEVFGACCILASHNNRFEEKWMANLVIWSDFGWQTAVIFIPASQWNTCQEIEQRTILVSWNIVLSSAEQFRYAPRFGIASLQFPNHLFVGCWYGTRRYIDKDNLPCRLAKLSSIETGNHAKYFSVDILVVATIEHSTCTS